MIRYRIAGGGKEKKGEGAADPIAPHSHNRYGEKGDHVGPDAANRGKKRGIGLWD